MDPIKIDFGKAFNDALEIFKKNFLLMLCVTLVAALVGVLSCGILMGAMSVAMCSIILRLIDNEEPKPVLGDLFVSKTFMFIVPTIVALIVAGVIGTISCGIGYIIIAPIVHIAFFRMADKGDTSMMGALSEMMGVAFKAQGGFMMVILTLVAMIIACLGGVVCGLGALVTGPFSAVIVACIYRQVYPKA